MNRRISPSHRLPIAFKSPHIAMNAIHYTITPRNPAAHLFEVSMQLESDDACRKDGIVLALPAWIPGSYMIREFARHIVGIEARSKAPKGGRSRLLSLNKLDKHSWQVAPWQGTLTVTWTVYAWDLSVRAAHLDRSHGFFNGTSVFLRALGREHLPHIVDIQKPSDPACTAWKVATSLTELKARRHGFGTYSATHYDELVDHPVEMGNFQLGVFQACGTEHEIVVTGHVPNLDMARLTEDVARICTDQIRFFEPRTAQAPFERYVFLVMAVGDGYGGLEHRASTALLCKRDDLPSTAQADRTRISENYGNFLGLVSHEYFHSWNVKRIKPAVFAPYAFDKEAYTRLLWIFEGFTSYYDDLFLRRTGLIDMPRYLERVAKTIATVHRGSGRLHQSVAESSFDAWTKYYRQDENSPNAIVSYYAKGSLVALAIDLTLRTRSGGRKSLDDVMRHLWRKFGRSFYPDNTHGLREDEFPELLHAATGIDLAPEIAAWAEGRADLPLIELFRSVGIELTQGNESGTPGLGIKLAAGECRIAHVYDGAAASKAGLSAGDVLLAVDGLRVTAGNLDTLLGRYTPGTRLPVHAFRRDELYSTTVTLDAPAPLKFGLNLRADARGGLARQWLRTSAKR